MPLVIHSFCPLKQPVIALVLGASLQGEGIRAAARLAEGIGADPLACHLGQILLLLRLAAPTDQRIVDQGVLHIDQDSGRGIDAGELFDGENGLEEGAAATTVLLRNLNTHEPELVKLLDQRVIHRAALIHLPDKGTD